MPILSGFEYFIKRCAPTHYNWHPSQQFDEFLRLSGWQSSLSPDESGRDIDVVITDEVTCVKTYLEDWDGFRMVSCHDRPVAGAYGLTISSTAKHDSVIYLEGPNSYGLIVRMGDTLCIEYHSKGESQGTRITVSELLAQLSHKPVEKQELVHARPDYVDDSSTSHFSSSNNLRRDGDFHKV